MSTDLFEEPDTPSILNSQRKDGEATDILTEIEKVKSTPPEKVSRWIWELLQNARDCAHVDVDGKRYVNVNVELSKDRFVFTHDGRCFTHSDLVSLFRKASNKDYQNGQDNSGKYGTGFVTTHLLCRQIMVDGFLQTGRGKKPVRLEMDRTANEPAAMQHALARAYEAIEEIRRSDGFEEVADVHTRFEFPLTPVSHQLAQDTIRLLKDNLSFTLRCNDRIKQVSVTEQTDEGLVAVVLREYPPIPLSGGLVFYPQTGEMNGEAQNGLFYFEGQGLKIGLPAARNDGHYALLPLPRAARLYKDFPLIGTEDWNLPYLIQSEAFRPPEQRDGVRMKKASDTEDDPVADINREMFTHLPKVISQLFEQLKRNQVSHLYYLAETGLPNDPFHYVDKTWYIAHIQQPLRDYFREQPLVSTADGSPEPKKVQQCLFIDYHTENGKSDFYDLVSELKPDKFPSKDSYLSWDLILHQEKDKWSSSIYYSPERLVENVAGLGKIAAFPFTDGLKTYKWLNGLFAFFKEHPLAGVDSKAIFPSQAGTLHVKSALKTDTLENGHFKNIVGVLDKSVLDQLVSNDLTLIEGCEPFDAKGFVKIFHDNISRIDARQLSINQLGALLRLVSLFRPGTAPVREEMYELVSGLLPQLPSRTIVDDMDYYEWTTPDLLMIKYSCCLVEKAVTLSAFAKNYFREDLEKAISWLKRLRIYLLGEEERRAPLLGKFKVTPMQSGNFALMTPETRAEDSITAFPNLLKDIHRDYVKEKDPYGWLVDRQMDNEHFTRISLQDFCKPIDNLFLLDDVEAKVKPPKGVYNKLFHQLHDFYKGLSDQEGKHLFPHFSGKLGELLHKAFGASVSRQVLLLQKWDRSEEELEQLTRLRLPATVLAKLEAAAIKIGVPEILAQVAQIQAVQEQAVWRRRVGGNAERAFVTAIAGLQTEFWDQDAEDPENHPLDNPDHGRDFTLRLKGWAALYSVEIKSVGAGKDWVTMSMKQGEFAQASPGHYALCVVTREENDEVSREQFLKTARFIPTIGELISPRINSVKAGIVSLEAEEAGDINILLDNKRYSINIGKKIWSGGLTFDEFVGFLQKIHPPFVKLP